MQHFLITYLLHTPDCVTTLSSMYYAGGPVSAAGENQNFASQNPYSGTGEWLVHFKE